ncbi:M4 family metallopeptidase [Flindersiella endophytica]
MKQYRLVGGLLAAATALSGAAFLAPTANAGSTGNWSAGGSNTVMTKKGSDGRTHIVIPKGGAIARPSGVSADPKAAATAHLATQAGKFGAKASDLKIGSVSKVGTGNIVKADQVIDGAKVIGGQLAVSLDKNGALEWIAGEAAPTVGSFPGATTYNKGQLAEIAKRAAALRMGQRSTEGMKVRTVGRNWYDPTLVGAPGAKPGARPVISYEVTAKDGSEKYQVMVNAATKQVEVAYDMHQEIDRLVCDANNTEVEFYDCANGNPEVTIERREGDGPSGIADVDNAYQYAHDTSVRYASYVNVDLTNLIGSDYADGEGKNIRSTVRFCVAGADCPYANAFWDGRQIAFGAGLVEDDVVAHEFTHGVTQNTSNLVYLFQAGAINEGLSDIWGEIVDQTNGSADDTAANRWKIGEGSSLGVIRDMANPPAFDQPDKMTSPIWFYDPSDPLVDNGGVHANSGVLNKAAYLLGQGGTFNGYTVDKIGLAKLGKITWSLQNLITSGADYKDIFYTMPLACRKNIGRTGSYITEADCQQVDKAVRATEMYKDPLQGAPTNVDYCPSGAVTSKYTQGFESKVADWTWDENWVLGSSVDFRYAAVGKDSAVAWVFAGDNKSLTQNTAIAATNGMFLRFDHSYLLDTGDAGRVEYSVNNGGTWQSASTLPNVGGPATFTGVSNGYSAARYDLSSLAGQNVKIRFRATAVTNNSAWWVDNVKFYTCG